MTYVCTYVSVTLRNVAVTSRRNVGNQRSHVILLRGRRVKPGNIRRKPWIGASRMDAEVDGAELSGMVVEKDVLGPSAMVVRV